MPVIPSLHHFELTSVTSPCPQVCSLLHSCFPQQYKAQFWVWKGTIVFRLDVYSKRAWRTPHLDGYDPILESAMHLYSYTHYKPLYTGGRKSLYPLMPCKKVWASPDPFLTLQFWVSGTQSLFLSNCMISLQSTAVLHQNAHLGFLDHKHYCARHYGLKINDGSSHVCSSKATSCYLLLLVRTCPVIDWCHARRVQGICSSVR